MDVLHSCDNPECTNPKHLFLGTQRDNMLDKNAKGRQARGAGNGRAKLDEAAVRDVFMRRQAGEPLRQVAAAHGISVAQVSKIATGKKWVHLDLCFTPQ